MHLKEWIQRNLLAAVIVLVVGAVILFNIVSRVTADPAASQGAGVEASEVDISNGSIWDDPSPEHLLGPSTLR